MSPLQTLNLMTGNMFYQFMLTVQNKQEYGRGAVTGMGLLLGTSDMIIYHGSIICTSQTLLLYY